MELALENGGGMFDRVELSLPRRDIVLIDLCLEIVARDYTKGARLRAEIEDLRKNLKHYLSRPGDSGKKQAECKADTGCKCQPGRRRQMEKIKDPICGMLLDPKKAEMKTEYGGKNYYFCTVACKKVFDARPDKYADPLLTELEVKS